jgi:NitT/TauT family transport system substrate-binding protein
MNKNIKILAGVAVVLIVAATIMLSGNNPTTTPEQTKIEKVTAIMSFIPSSEFVPVYFAVTNGYYAEEGLDVKVEHTAEGSFSAIKQVAAGSVNFGYAVAGGSVILARSQDIPVVSVYQHEHNDLFGIITKNSSNITKPSDFVGKTIAMPGAGSPPDISVKAILKNSGVDYNQVKIVSVGGALIPTILQDKSDAIAGYIIHELILEAEGVPYSVMYPKDYSANLVTGTIITNEDMIENNPELVEKFVRATAKGLRYAIDNPEKAVDSYIKNFNPDAEKDRALEMGYWNRIVNEVIEPSKFKLGDIDKNQWTTTQDTLFNIGVIDKKTDLSKAYTTEFLPK